MMDRVWGQPIPGSRGGRAAEAGKPRRALLARRPQVEGLEGRELMAAALAAIAPVTVPQSLGYQVELNGSAAATAQTFTATSSNPDVKATVATGNFMTINVTHTAASGVPGDVTFSGPVTFQLFQDLTPMTVGKIESFVTSGFYTNKTIHRIAGNFSNQGLPNDFVIQGGAPNPDGTGSSGLPGTPFGLEIVQQLAYVNPGSLAMARGASPNSNDTQFFFTTGTPTSLDQNYTIFGQVVAGQDTIAKLEQVATTTNTSLGGEKSKPISPVTINSATLSNTNPNGVVHIDATGAVRGETATVTVVATDPLTRTTATQTFPVTVGADTTTHATTFTFKPLAFPVTQAAQAGVATTVQLNGTTQNPGNGAVHVTYALASQPAHGAISNFNATTGALTYTATPGFSGVDTFTYSVTNTGGTPSPLQGNTQKVTLNVTTAPVPPPAPVTVNTGFVRVVGNVLVVSPLPHAGKGVPNTVVLSEALAPGSPANNRVTVTINGQLDTLQPLVSSLDSIEVYGSKGADRVTVDPALDATLPVTLDGGHGGKNALQAGAGTTREHGWFGFNVLKGGAGENQLIGRAGHVRFVPTATSTTIFAGRAGHEGRNHRITPPSGTFYRDVNGKAVPITTATHAHKTTTTKHKTTTTKHKATTTKHKATTVVVKSAETAAPHATHVVTTASVRPAKKH